MGKLIGLDYSKDFVKPENGYGFKVNLILIYLKIFFFQLDGDFKKNLLFLF